MIEIQCLQGSENWHAARIGVCTGSMFSTARAKVGLLDEKQQKFVDGILIHGMTEKQSLEWAGYKAMPRSTTVEKALRGDPIGEPSEAALDYAMKLAVERLGGVTYDDKFETWAMKRGYELEPQARIEHELQYGVSVRQIGFMTTDDNLFGVSVDGLIDPNGGAEYKCLVSPARLRQWLFDGNTDDFTDQCQGGMWISDRAYWHLCLYCPMLESIGKQLHVIEMKRDDNYISELITDLWAFEEIVQRYMHQLKQ